MANFDRVVEQNNLADIFTQIKDQFQRQLVLGFPWLARHNPTIDWQSGSLLFVEYVMLDVPRMPNLSFN